jgi:ribosomal protein S18 acetylase RimI-like enzyme
MFNFIFLHKGNLEEMLELQDKMVKVLPRKDLYYGDMDLINRRLVCPDSVIGMRDGDKLIAFHVMDIPIREENLGVDLGFSEEDLLHVGQIGPICIDPEYQGRGIMKQIIKPHLDILKETGYHHVLATVSPYNYGSMKYVLTHGFSLMKITEKYEGMSRAIVHLNLNQEHRYKHTKVLVPNYAIKTQLDLISNGYCGHSLERTENGFDIIYSIKE